MATSVYQDALAWAEERGGSGSELMKKMLLSLYNDNNPFPLAEGLRRWDATAKDHFFACAAHYANNGETKELKVVGDFLMQPFWNEQAEIAKKTHS